MKKLLIAAVLVAVPAVSFGKTGINCEAVADFSRTVMEGRQYGTPMRKMIEINNTAGHEGLRSMNQKIIEIAYSRPQFTTEQEAHDAWRKRKLELAHELAAIQTDPRVAKALVDRYSKPLA